MLLTIIVLSQSVYADIDTNLDGGGGNLGQGSTNNGWAVSSTGGGLIYDADGLRVYIVNSSTGHPVSNAIDITKYDISNTDIRNGQGTTKFDYNHVNPHLNFNNAYQPIKAPNSLPRIISNTMTANAAADAARIEAIREWFTDHNHYEWTISQFGFSMAEMQAAGYKIAIEPIAYFRYQGYNYAMTATEAALFDDLASGALSSAMGPLTRQNLPLALFLEDDAFINSPFRINEWGGSTNSYASNGDILNQLGIGLISVFDGDFELHGGTSSTASFSYTTDTWVVTSFRLCNIEGGGTPGHPITSRNPATAQIMINGTTYNISNIYIPRGGEQLIWAKWKTPSTPQTVTGVVAGSKGLIYDIQSSTYVDFLTVNIDIYDNDMERTPPDPTLDDTATRIVYCADKQSSAIFN
jgi:hypothetical protein